MIIKLNKIYNKKDLKKEKNIFIYYNGKYENIKKWLDYSDAPWFKVDILGNNLTYIGHDII